LAVEPEGSAVRKIGLGHSQSPYSRGQAMRTKMTGEGGRIQCISEGDTWMGSGQNKISCNTSPFLFWADGTFHICSHGILNK
jgi:hypothetical protein